jgi:hypothetical protein
MRFESWTPCVFLADERGVIMVSAQSEAIDRAVDRLNKRLPKSPIKHLSITQRMRREIA